MKKATTSFMEHFRYILLYILIAITTIAFFGGLFYTIILGQKQGNENQQAMVKQASQACNGHLLFFFREYSTGHPIFGCAEK